MIYADFNPGTLYISSVPVHFVCFFPSTKVYLKSCHCSIIGAFEIRVVSVLNSQGKYVPVISVSNLFIVCVVYFSILVLRLKQMTK